ncbi:uncharacterized protein A1O9_00679, partial [Exophiala aquamarina CBS 119918]
AIYHPLHSTSNAIQIRLCSLLPGSFGDRINCRITNFDLNSTLEFEALSYTWGDLRERIPIEADSETILITKSIATALEYLRSESDSRYLWIDAISIDQENNDERNSQVALMRRIYRSAMRVISWLGIRDSSMDAFVEM